MGTVKKSIYLDDDLDRALKASAQRDGRSVTKQIDHLLRRQLLPEPVVGGLKVVSTSQDMRDVRPYSKEYQTRSTSKKLR